MSTGPFEADDDLQSWLAGSLAELVRPSVGVTGRVLDVGCGDGRSSAVLAERLGAAVCALDWLAGAGIARRAAQAGVAELVRPVRADVLCPPFGGRVFDAAVSVSAYHYWGSDPKSTRWLARTVVPGGRIAFASPGIVEEFATIPEHLSWAWREYGWSTFHSPAWWRSRLEESGAVDVESAEVAAGGFDRWLEDVERGRKRRLDAGLRADGPDRDILVADGGANLCYVRVVGIVVS